MIGGRPYATQDEAYAELAASPAVRELRGHPKAITMFAPLLEEQRLEDLLEKAKQCYAEASQVAQAETPSMGEEAGNGKGGLLQDGSGRGLVGGGEGAAEMDAMCLEREAEEAKRYIRDPNCQRLWLEVREI